MRAGDVEELLSARGQDLLRFAYQLTHDRPSAEDAVQEAAARMLKYPSRDIVQSNYAYARTVISRIIYDQVGKAAVSRENLTRDPPEIDNVANPVDESISRLDLWAALRKLNNRSRTVLVLRYYCDLSDKEIAKVLDCADGTARSALSRSRDELKKILEKQGNQRSAI